MANCIFVLLSSRRKACARSANTPPSEKTEGREFGSGGCQHVSASHVSTLRRSQRTKDSRSTGAEVLRVQRTKRKGGAVGEQGFASEYGQAICLSCAAPRAATIRSTRTKPPLCAKKEECRREWQSEGGRESFGSRGSAAGRERRERGKQGGRETERARDKGPERERESEQSRRGSRGGVEWERRGAKGRARGEREGQRPREKERGRERAKEEIDAKQETEAG